VRHSLLLSFAILTLFGCQQQPADDIHTISEDYLTAWADFYPSRALSAGMAEAAPHLEDFTQPMVTGWIAFNTETLNRLEQLPAAETVDDRIDRRLLTGQAWREGFRWDENEAHRRDSQTYSNLINHCLTAVLVRSNLTNEMKVDAVIRRLQALQTLAKTAQQNLETGRPTATAASIRNIRSTAAFIAGNLASALGMAEDGPNHEHLSATSAATAQSLNELAKWMETDLEPLLGDAYGEDHYARKLALTYGAHMTPEILERIATEEIATVRGLMEKLARSMTTEGGPTDFAELVQPILAEMESHRAANQEEFLAEFVDLVNRSEQFLIDRDLVDLPENRTLFTALSPTHFAGAAVGGVYPAGPFDPEAETLFYLPSVPDSAPEEARDGFYRSFNHFFNTMIITHEIYPGHYHQLKAAAAHPSRIRMLFAGDDFTEGWASFCEQMTLDAGWDDDRPLTRMAHLRKRLENAVRAYVSVQVHCRGWDRDQLQAFAVDTGLLPPQFAENLWQRAVLTPIQLPSYFIGFRVFDEAFRNEQTRLGEAFSAKDFNNAVIESGGIPLDLLADSLVQVRSSEAAPE